MGDPHDLNLLAAHVEGRLDAREQAEVIQHAAGCSDCRGVLAALARDARADVIPRQPVQRAFGALSRARGLLPIAATLALATVALVLVLRTGEVGPSAGPQRGPAPEVLGASTPAPDPAPSVGSLPQSKTSAPQRPGAIERSGRPAEPDPGLLARRSGERRVGSKSFHLAAGEWIDREYDPLAGLPVFEATSPEARAALLARMPPLRRYAALGARVTVVHAGTVYRLGAIDPR